MKPQTENDSLPPLLNEHRNNLIENCRQAPDNFFDDFPPFILNRIKSQPRSFKPVIKLWWPVSAVAAVGLVFLILQVVMPGGEPRESRINGLNEEGIADVYTVSEIGLHELEYFLADEFAGDVQPAEKNVKSEETFSDYDLWLLHQPEYELLTLQTEL